MPYKIFTFLLFIILNSCVTAPVEKKDISATPKSFFVSKGFTLVYNESLYKEKLLKGKIEDRSLTIFQKNLKKNTKVKITNLINSKYIIANVGKKVEYPYFYNSVVSRRISEELELDILEPYIEIKEIVQGSSFIAKKAKTYDEEKNVAEKVPVNEIKIDDLSKEKIETINKSKKTRYTLLISDFYYEVSAKKLKKNLIKTTKSKKIFIKKINDKQYRLLVGPFNNFNALKAIYISLNNLGFEDLNIYID